MTDIDMKALEKKAWKSTFQDGLWDIMLGLTFFIPAVMGLVKASDYVLIPLYTAAILLFVVAKKHVTIPRIGLVKFGDVRQKKRHIVTLILSVSVVVLMLIMLTNNKDLLPELEGLQASALLVGLNILIVLGAMAYFLNFGRLYLYAVLLGVTEPLSSVLEGRGLLEGPYPILLVISSGMILLGAGLFIRFLNKYPLAPGGTE